MWEIFKPFEELLASQERLCAMELDSLDTTKHAAIKLNHKQELRMHSTYRSC
jgi:hypothetical protein